MMMCEWDRLLVLSYVKVHRTTRKTCARHTQGPHPDRLTVFLPDEEEVAETVGCCSVRATFRPPFTMSERPHAARLTSICMNERL